MSDDLKPCPFCGDIDYLSFGTVRDGRSLGCARCKCSIVEYNGPPDNTAEARLITAWNTRAALADTPRKPIKPPYTPET